MNIVSKSNIDTGQQQREHRATNGRVQSNAGAVTVKHQLLNTDTNDENEHGRASGFQACRLGDLEMVKRLVNKDNCNDRETVGRKSSCLHFAAGFGRRLVCEYLLNECGADPSIKDEGYV